MAIWFAAPAADSCLRRLGAMGRLVAIGLLLALAAAGCGDDGETARPRCAPDPADAPPPDGYRGTLFDAHVHLDDAGIVEPLVCAMDRGRVEAAAVSAHMDPEETFASDQAFRDAVRGHESRFRLFFHVDPGAPADMSPDRLARVIDDVGLFFVGIGEVTFSRPPWRGVTIADEPWPAVFELADDRDVLLSVRLTGDQGDELERMLERFPRTRVLLSGPELHEELPGLLRGHENLFFTLDGATLLGSSGGPSLSDVGGAADFAARSDAAFEQALPRAVDAWLPVVQAAPRRVMWGTDASAVWHASAEVYGRLVEFSRAFIGRLPRPFQAPFAAGNARRLLGGPEPPEADA